MMTLTHGDIRHFRLPTPGNRTGANNGIGKTFGKPKKQKPTHHHKTNCQSKSVIRKPTLPIIIKKCRKATEHSRHPAY